MTYKSPYISDLPDKDKWKPTPDDIRDQEWEHEYLEELNQERRQHENAIRSDNNKPC